jgi:hypothetical protein
MLENALQVLLGKTHPNKKSDPDWHQDVAETQYCLQLYNPATLIKF